MLYLKEANFEDVEKEYEFIMNTPADENGFSPMEAALQTGFSDQSHFTNYFNRFFGLAPGAYRKIFHEKGSEDGKE